VTILVFPAFAQEQLSGQEIILETDKTAYYEGDVITITGYVSKVISGLDMSIQIFSEGTTSTNLVEIAQINVSEDGEFTKTFRATGPQWQSEGTIVIKATYGAKSNELNVKFFKQTGTSFTSDYEVDIPQGGTFDIEYTLKGGVLTLMELDQENLSLEINMNTDSDGALDIQIPRSSIDSLDESGFDENFIVLIYTNGELYPIQTEYNEIETNSESRSLYIPIKDGDYKIQVIGTHVVPEFGTIAAIILAVAITSIIVLSAKTRLNIIPKL
tara:strand:+ start:128 stop:940 length:813 start_codon:yes stop_codon:yes gene_type:complete